MTRLFAFLWAHSRGAFLLALASGICGGAGGVGLLALIPAAIGAEGYDRRRLGLIFAGLCALTILARVATQVAMIRVAQGSVVGLVRNLCARILNLSLSAMEGHDAGALTAVLTQDVVSLTTALSALPIVLINITVFLGCFVYLAVLSRDILICTLLFAAPAILSHQFLTRRGLRLMIRARAEQDALIGHFRELIEGFKELKLHRDRRDAFLAESIEGASGRARDQNMAAHSVFAVVAGWGQLLYFGYLGFLAFGLPALVELPSGVVAASVLTVVYAMSPLDSLLNWLPIVARAGASMGRIEAMGLSLDAISRCKDEGPSRVSAPMRKSLTLHGVTHKYPGEKNGEGFTLGPVDLSIAHGEMVFLVGGNGSGKTTLVKLLTGLYPATSGSIHYDGRLIESTNLEAYRQSFTVVFADGFLFPTLLGLKAPDLDARAAELLNDLGLDRVVHVENGAFSTTDLSQGQRKRLALLAACLEDRPVMVLDEWASYQDPVFKRAFYLEILPGLKARGKTLIVISHDEDYFFVADRVVHLSAGMVTGETAVDTDSAAGTCPPIGTS